MPTIAAIATPPGQGGIAIVRVSGPGALPVLKSVFRPAGRNFNGFVPWRLHHGSICSASGEILDDVLAVFMPGPATFTGEDAAEIHCHGGAVPKAVLDLLLRSGARLADRREFSRRA